MSQPISARPAGSPPGGGPRGRRRRVPWYKPRALLSRFNVLRGEIDVLRDRLFAPRPPKTAVLMMQKNEHLLLEFWFTYHAALFGAENLYVFDNGSTDPAVIALLDRIEAAGCRVIREFSDAASFHRKGMVLLQTMNRLRREGYRLFFPLDCDEFIAVRTQDGPSIDPEAIRAELSRCLAAPAHAIGPCLNNNPLDSGRFLTTRRWKVFGSFRGLTHLGCGFHQARVRTRPSAIFYFHYHNRPFADLQAKAAAKLTGHGVDVETDDLRHYAVAGRNGGRFNVRYLLQTEDAYLRRYADAGEPCPMLRDWFRARLGRVPFEEVPAPPRMPTPSVT